jgi:uncharacterized SAM-binding protein YcdF (DUF218 family)
MTVLIVLILLVVAAVLDRVGLRRSARALFVLTAILTLAIGCGLVPAQMSRNLQSGYPDEAPRPWRQRTAIIVLGGGIQQIADTRGLQVLPLVYGRIVKGVELYRQCKHAGGACVLLVSGGDPLELGDSEAAVYARVLERIGVDQADIAIEGRSLNTWQNARFCAVWLSAHPQDRVILVTSGLHVRRSVLYFSHFGIHAGGVRADYEGAAVQAVPLAYNFLLTDLALHEYAGLVRYHVYELLGLNVEARHAGAP